MTIQIEEGEFYKRADGSIHGPAERVPNNARYPWRLGTVNYTDQGWFYGDEPEHKMNLVAEAEPERTLADVIAEVETEAAEERAEVVAAATAATEAKYDIKTYIADEAKRIVSGARRSAYGKPEANFERIARFWTAYMANVGKPVEITAADVSPLMVLMKLARLAESPQHLDSMVDAVGYTLTMAETNGVLPPA